MSKTSQRKRSAHAQGYADAKTGFRYRWKSHPYLNAYDAGYRMGQAERGDLHVRRQASNRFYVACGGFLFVLLAFLLILAALGK